MKAANYQVIEQSSRGATYQNDADTFTVYHIGKYPRGSVLAGQQRRMWLDDFETLAAAQSAYPAATLSGCTYREPSLHHLPGSGDGSNDY